MKKLLLLASLLTVFATVPLHAQLDWSVVGSGGIIDEDSLNLYAMTMFDLEFRPGQVGTITARYPVQSPNHPLPGWTNALIGGSGSGVSVKLIEATQCIPQNPPRVLCDFGPSNAAGHFCQTCDFFGPLNFNQNAYYFEVTLTRPTTATNPKLHMIGLN